MHKSQRFLTVEVVALFGLCIFFLLKNIFSYPYVFPSGGGGEILQQFAGTKSYLSYLILAAVVYITSMAVRQFILKKPPGISPTQGFINFFRLTLASAVCFYLMLVFKWWSHIGTATYDDMYYAFDNAIGGYGWIDAIAGALPIDHMMYFRLFAFSIVFTYLVCAAIRFELLERVVTGNAIVAVVGGLGYMIAPAYGPFIFLPSHGALHETQQMMLQMTEKFREIGGPYETGFYMEGVLGAMPSLHIAHVLVLSYYISKLSKWLGRVFGVFSVYIAIYAVVTRFHYIIDLFAGAALAILAVYCTEWLAMKLRHKSRKY